MTLSKRLRFPIGHEVALADLESDPYQIFARLRAREPITWLRALDMWYVTGYEDIRTAMLDTTRLTTASDRSTIFETFGAHMLTTEDPTHDRYRRAAQYPFTPAFIRAHFESAIAQVAAELLSEFEQAGCADLRVAYASRLPVCVILLVCGLPPSAQAQMRRWYDSFEVALANFTGEPLIRAAAQASITEFHGLLDDAMAAARNSDSCALIPRLVNAPAAERLHGR